MPEQCSTWPGVVRDIALALTAVLGAGLSGYFTYRQVIARWTNTQATKRKTTSPKPRTPTEK